MNSRKSSHLRTVPVGILALLQFAYLVNAQNTALIATTLATLPITDTLPKTVVGTPAGVVGTAPSALVSTAPIASGNVTCSWEGSVADYLTCQKETVSTTTLIAAGIGVTLGILLLVGVGVWICHRKSANRVANRRISHQQYRESSEDEDEYVEAQLRPPVPGIPILHRDEKRDIHPPPPLESKRLERDRGSTSDSDVSLSRLTPPPPHPAHIPRSQTQDPHSTPMSNHQSVRLPSQFDASGSPLPQPTPERVLVPSNPDPTPPPRPQVRQVKQPSMSAMRQSSYSRRNSLASVRFDTTRQVDPMPMPMPMPVPGVGERQIPTRSGTMPLQIRKSTLGGSPPGSRRPSAAIPSYYEATHGEGVFEVPRPVSTMITKPPTASIAGTTSEATARPAIGSQTAVGEGVVPPIPNERPLVVRKPSAPVRRQTDGPQRGSAERGGMI